MSMKNARSSTLLCLFCLGLLLSIFTPTSLFAMGASPTPKERPDAVILLVEKNYQVSPSGNYTLTLHLKTLINTFQGRKSWADFKTSYNSRFENIKIIEAKTITPEGKIVPVTEKEIHDITDPSTQAASLFSASRLKVVNFPSVEEGCTVELVLKKTSSLGLWAVEPFSLINPVRVKKVTVSLPKNLTLSVHIASNSIKSTKKTLNERTVYSWQGRDLPRLIPDPMMPPVENRADTLIFSTLGSWKDVSGLLKRLLLASTRENGKRFLDIAKGLKGKAADEIYLELKKRLEIFPIAFFRSNMAFSAPDVTLKRGYGSQMDAMLLFCKLLDLSGIDYQILAANSGGVWLKGLKDCYDPAFFNTFLVRTDGKYYSFDIKEAPPGITGLNGQLALNIKDGSFETVKDAFIQEATQEFDTRLSSPSSFTVDYHGGFYGLKAVSLKKTFRDLTPGEFKVRQSIFFHSLHPLARPLSPLEITGITPGSSEVTINARYKVKDFSLQNNRLFFFPIQAPGLIGTFFGLPPKRKSDVFIKRPMKETVQARVTFPDGLIPEKVPDGSSGIIGPFSWSDGCHVSQKGLLCTRTVTVKRGFLKNGEEFKMLQRTLQRLLSPGNNTISYREGLLKR